MSFEFTSENGWLLSLVGVSIFILFLIAALVLYVVLGIIEKKLRRKSSKGVVSQIIICLRKPSALLLVFFGLYLGLLSLPGTVNWRDTITTAWTVIAVLLIGHSLAKISTLVINWYIRTHARRTATRLDDKLLPIARRFLTIAIYGISTLMILDNMGISISPLIGGLGITGLAVALALQPTLGNFFAGTYVLSDGAISSGDYIELQGGPSGYVKEIGWRSTKIRTWLNNLVIVPNSVLADTIVTNYQVPDPAINVVVKCGVSYESNLEQVEQITLEVAQHILETCPDAVTTMAPWFAFNEFGDSNIGFWILVQAKTRVGSFVVTNELIKQLHARFAKEQIEINYPVRKLVYPDIPQGNVNEQIPS
jgi:small-conductance mechanosensitive channel